MINRLFLEKYQAIIYFTGIFLGLLLGEINPDVSKKIEIILWPTLGFLLYTTFSQIPLSHIPMAYLNYKFLFAAILGNFLIIPIVVAIIVNLLPDDKALKLGVALVLLVPCTDWFITFTQLGGGDTKYAVALSPINLLTQFLLLPIYIFLLFGAEFTINLAKNKLFEIALLFIVLPLSLAYFTEKMAEKNYKWKKFINILSWLPVPLLSIIVLIIFSSQYQIIKNSMEILGFLSILFFLYLLLSALIALIITFIFRFPFSQGKVLLYSFGTRNSFVVLPIALALPREFETTMVVVAFQAFIELIGMIIYVTLIPNGKIFNKNN